MKKAIYGAGGFSRDIIAMTRFKDIRLFVDDEYWKNDRSNVLPLSKFDPFEYEMILSVSNPQFRENMVNRLPKETKFWSFIHPTALLEDPEYIEFGEGLVLSAYGILVCNSKIGRHAQLNWNTVIGHDSSAGDFFTTGPGANIAGDCLFGNRVHLGMNSSVKEKVWICDDVTIGMGAVVVKNINEPGTYVGVPAKKIK